MLISRLFVCTTLLVFSFQLGLTQASIELTTEIDDLETKFRNLGTGVDKVEGWRIQILATTERRNLDSEKQKLRQVLPQLKYEEKYKKPYYRLTTGASVDKLLILPELYKIKKYFPSAFLVRDKEIEISEILR